MQSGRDYIGVGVGAMIFNDQSELLLLKRGEQAKNERGHWQIPGGAIDYGETMIEAVIRETKEEVGVDVVVERQLVAIDHILEAEQQHWVTVTFLAHIKPGQTAKIFEPHKHAAIGWFPLDKLPMPLAAPLMTSINAYQQIIKGGV